MIERARTITRRNNPQPFFNLFRPVVRTSNDNPTNHTGDNTDASEAQVLPSRSDSTNTAQPSDTAEGTLEVIKFRRIHKRTGANRQLRVSMKPSRVMFAQPITSTLCQCLFTR